MNKSAMIFRTAAICGVFGILAGPVVTAPVFAGPDTLLKKVITKVQPSKDTDSVVPAPVADDSPIQPRLAPADSVRKKPSPPPKKRVKPQKR